MSWWDKVDRWWQTGHGLRSPSVLVPAHLTSYRVVLSDKPDAKVEAEAVNTSGGMPAVHGRRQGGRRVAAERGRRLEHGAVSHRATRRRCARQTRHRHRMQTHFGHGSRGYHRPVTPKASTSVDGALPRRLMWRPFSDLQAGENP